MYPRVCVCLRVCVLGFGVALIQYTYIVASHGIDAVDLLETDAAYAGTVYNYRVARVSDGTFADCAALAASGWGAALRWVIPSPPSSSAWCCSATGITCGGPDGRVTEIRLASQQLTGMREQAKPMCMFALCVLLPVFDPHANAMLHSRKSTRVSIVDARCTRDRVVLVGDVSLGSGVCWAGLGLVGLGWDGLGWAGLCWVGSG